ncbi:MAG: nucleoside deaminase [Bacteroidetes bacterium]|nr:nucleoside deaminase [Bacteroidota bacterium]
MKKKFMMRAIELAHSNIKNLDGGPFGAVIVKDGKIIGEGSNKVLANDDPTAHAEIVAIRAACKKLNNFQLEGCEIYSSCEPCPMCLGAIYWARPSKLYFAAGRDEAAKANFDDSIIYKEVCLPIHERKIPSKQFMKEESLEVFNEWKENNLNIEY